jgi:hypothetical protein
MSELKTLAIDKLDPNPWRDGTGNATWKSVEKTYGYDSGKIEELRASIVKNEVWEGILARPVASRYQIAFGHHRIAAALLENVKSVPIIVRDLTDEQMLTFMANENSTYGGSNFPLGVMNPVAALLSAYAAGVVDLTPDPKSNDKHIRMLNTTCSASPKSYTVNSVAAHFGWVRDGSGQALPKVGIALDLLDYEKRGLLNQERILSCRTIEEARLLRDFTAKALEVANVPKRQEPPKPNPVSVPPKNTEGS